MITRRDRPTWSKRSHLLYVVPALVMYVAFIVLPALQTIYLSQLSWDGVSPAKAAGLANYVKVLSDPQLRDSIVHALVLVAFFSLIPVALGLAMTGLLIQARRRGMSAYRLIFFLPQVVPPVAIGITWRWMYAPEGIVNQTLRWIGMGDFAHAWLGDFQLALPAVGLVGTWAMSGLCMMLFLSGVQAIDKSLLEAARVDGAGPIREFRSIILPELRGQIVVAATVTTIAALASFDIVYVTTNGAPGDSTTVPGLLIYRLAFSQGEVGLASALAVVLTALVIGVVMVINRRPQDPDA